MCVPKHIVQWRLYQYLFATIIFNVNISTGDIWKGIWALVKETVPGGDGCPGFEVRAKQAMFCVLGTQWGTRQKLSPPRGFYFLGGSKQIIEIHTLSPRSESWFSGSPSGTLSHSFRLSASINGDGHWKMDTGEVPLFPQCDHWWPSRCRGNRSRGTWLQGTEADWASPAGLSVPAPGEEPLFYLLHPL